LVSQTPKSLFVSSTSLAISSSAKDQASKAPSVRINDLVLLDLIFSKKSNISLYYVGEVLSEESGSNWKIKSMRLYRTQSFSVVVFLKVQDVTS
jgi:hypothetical protein